MTVHLSTLCRLGFALAVAGAMLATALFLGAGATADALPPPVHTTAADFQAGILTHTQAISLGDGAVTLATVGVPGPWSAGPDLPAPRMDLGVAALGASLYAIGGASAVEGLQPETTIYRARWQNGVMAAWKRLPQELPVGLAGFAVLKLGTSATAAPALYLFGGYRRQGYAFPSVASVYRLPVAADGSIIAVETLTATLPVALHYTMVASADEDVYLIGGISNATSQSPIYHSRLLADGRLAAWQAVGALPEPRVAGAAAVIATSSGSRWLYIVGGQDHNRTSRPDVLVADLLPDGSLGPLQYKEDLPAPLSFFGLVSREEQFWLTGGLADEVVTSTQQAALPAAGGFRVWPIPARGPWITGAPLPRGRWRHGSAILGERLWVVGGQEMIGASALPLAATSSAAVRGLGAGSWPAGQFEDAFTLPPGSQPRILSISTAITNSALATLTLQYRLSPTAPWRDHDLGGRPVAALALASPDLEVTREATFTIGTDLTSTSTSSVEYRVFMTSTQPGVTPALHRVALTYLPPEAQLRVSKQADRRLVKPGDLLTYTLAITNYGSGPASAVILTDRLPANTVFVAAPQATLDRTVVHWAPTALAPNEGAHYILIIRVARPLPARTVAVVNDDYGVTSAESRPQRGRPVEVEVDGHPQLHVMLESSAIAVAHGDLVTFTLTVTNSGPIGSAGVVLSDRLPGGFTVVNSNGGGAGPGLLWSLGDLPGDGGTSERQIVVRAENRSSQPLLLRNEEYAASSTEGLIAYGPPVTVSVAPLFRFHAWLPALTEQSTLTDTRHSLERRRSR
ncbi:MAG: hypothetical protein M5U01_25470 [Ardenticatenaceae bacterium]|nr:hypothetical protein [Ardenticatenaceae bacterium]